MLFQEIANTSKPLFFTITTANFTLSWDIFRTLNVHKQGLTFSEHPCKPAAERVAQVRRVVCRGLPSLARLQPPDRRV
jgi:hypothetical protein